MIVVIQCAASKRAGAGFFKTIGGKKVLFVADPAKAPKTNDYIYARPDDPADRGVSWRRTLLLYNEGQGNPLELLQAYQLYENDTYRRLVSRFGIARTFILSAGWGLVGASFLIPYYDITFSSSVKRTAAYKFRHKKDVYHDLCQLPTDTDEPIVFFGGKDYVPMFCILTRSYRGKRIVFYNAMTTPDAPGCLRKRYDTSTRTNWHYECANVFLDGKITVDDTELTLCEKDRIANVSLGNKRAWPDGGSARALPSRSARPPNTEDFREALRAAFDEAERDGLTIIDVRAADLHRRVGGYPGVDHRMPICCAVMYHTMTLGDKLLAAPPSGRGASLVIRYKLPRTR